MWKLRRLVLIAVFVYDYASGANNNGVRPYEVKCPVHSRVYSVTTRDSAWLDFMSVSCTGPGNIEMEIPNPELVASGGPEPMDWSMCNNTAGLKSMTYAHPTDPFCGASDYRPVINLNVTCADGRTHRLANDKK